MLASFRKFTKSWAAKVLIGLLVLAFGVLGFGASDAFKTQLDTNIVLKAGDREVTREEFKREFQRNIQQYEQQAKRPIPVDEAVKAGLDKQVLSIMSARYALAAVVDKLGIRIGDKMLSQQLSKTPDFFDPITGKFDKQTYEALLGENGLTPAIYEKQLSDDIANQHTLGALSFGLKASRTHGAFQAAYAMQARDTKFFAVDPSKVTPPPPPTDAQLSAFLSEFAEQATKPEFRQLTIVRFSAKALASGVTVTPQQVQQVFDFRKDELSSAETRTVIQIPAKDQAAAAAIAARLAKGEDPAAVAKSLGATPITYADKPKTAIADRKVADAAFALPAGQSSGPITGELGLAVVKVTAIKPGKTVTLADVRPQMEEEARTRAAEQKISEISDQFEKAYSGGASMAEAAKTVGLTPTTTPPVTKTGADQKGQPVTGLSQKVLETAFGLAAGGDSEVLEDTRGEYYVVHVDKVIPPALPSINEVRAPLTRAYMARAYQKKLQARADELAARIRKGESVEAVAASIGAKVAGVAGLNRITAQAEAAKVGGPLIGAILNAKAGEVIVAASGPVFIVGRVEAVRAGDAGAMAQITNQARQQITGEFGKEFEGMIADAARAAVKIKTYPDRAQAALGVEPAPASKDEGKAG